MMLRGDISGNSVGSEFSWTAAIGASFEINEHVKLEAQHKALGMTFAF